MAIDGVLVVDKPPGIVSMRVVEQVRRVLRQRRAGHTGTLDPAATGVLPICLGEATKIARYLSGDDKEYLATVRLGLETDSGDLDGEVLSRQEPPPALEEALVEEALAQFRGTIRQRPPALSAIRVQGERLYDRVRRGEEVDVPEREVTLHQLELLASRPAELDLRVVCSKGTYIRSLAIDVGRLLGYGGCLASLRRTRAGSLSLPQAVALDELRQAALSEAEKFVLPAAQALAHLPRVCANETGLRRLRQGQVLAPEHFDQQEDGTWEPQAQVCLLDGAGRLAAVAEVQGDLLQPRRVFTTPL
jgi:tRNA pseudouridine55 synthase